MAMGLSNPFRVLYKTLFPKSKAAQQDEKMLDVLAVEWNKLAKDIVATYDVPSEAEPIWLFLNE